MDENGVKLQCCLWLTINGLKQTIRVEALFYSLKGCTISKRISNKGLTIKILEYFVKVKNKTLGT